MASADLPDRAEDLAAQAARCRRLAAIISNDRTRKALLNLADEYDSERAQLLAGSGEEK